MFLCNLHINIFLHVYTTGCRFASVLLLVMLSLVLIQPSLNASSILPLRCVILLQPPVNDSSVAFLLSCVILLQQSLDVSSAVFSLEQCVSATTISEFLQLSFLQSSVFLLKRSLHFFNCTSVQQYGPAKTIFGCSSSS